MEKRNRYKIVVVACLLAIISLGKANAEKRVVNILSKEYFGFEAGVSGWYFWGTNDYWNVSTDRASDGNYSMKFSYPDLSTVANTVKAQTGGDNEGAKFEVPQGTHSVALKVFVESETTINAFRMVIKEPWKIYTWDISTAEKGKWVTLTQEMTFPEDISSDWQLVVEGSETGGGTFYIDEISIMMEVDIEAIVPDVSLVGTVDAVAINLEQDQYKMKLNVWKDEATDVPGFYTSIKGADLSLYWDLSNVSNNSWQQLEQNFTNHIPTNNGGIEIIVPNNQISGGGIGTFYIDDLKIIKEAYPVEQSKPVAVAGDDFTVTKSTSISLNGTHSYDLENDPLTFIWLTPDGIELNDPTSPTPSFPTPNNGVDVTYEFSLVVNDGAADSEKDMVKVLVKAGALSADRVNLLSDLKIYPNPGNGKLFLEGNKHAKGIVVWSMEGNNVYSQCLNGFESFVQLPNLSKGLYTIEFESENGRSVYKKFLLK